MRKNKLRPFVAAVSAAMIFGTTLLPAPTVVLAENTNATGIKSSVEVESFSGKQSPKQQTTQMEKKTNEEEKNGKKASHPDEMNEDEKIENKQQDEQQQPNDNEKEVDEDKLDDEGKSSGQEPNPSEGSDEQDETKTDEKESEIKDSNDEEHDASKEEETREQQEGKVDDATVEEEEETTVEENELHIEHEPITTIDRNKDILIEAKIPHATKVVISYQTGKNMQMEEIPMEQQADSDMYHLQLPKKIAKEIFWSPHFYYSIHAQNKAGETITTDVFEVEVVDNEPIDFNQVPPLLITEITPDTANVNKKDAYEFIEIYNNTNQPIQMNDYEIMYRYPDGKADVTWKITDDKTVDPQETFIVWIHNEGNKDLTLADFNKHYGLQLTDDDVAIVHSDGMANGSERTILLADKYQNEVSGATYTKQDVTTDKGIVYAYPSSEKMMKKVGVSETITPLEIIPGQVPAEPVQVDAEGEAPVIKHEQPEITDEEIIELSVEVTSEEDLLGVKAHVKQSDDAKEKTIQMEETDDPAIFTVRIPREEIWGDTLYYYFTAANQAGETTSETFELEMPENQVDFQNIPELFITEIVPDSSNVNGLDGYEFIEVYNNSNQDIDFSEYVIRYRYPNTGKSGDLLWEPDSGTDVIIPSGEAVVFWIINNGNGHLSGADFNQNYGSNLAEGKNLFRMSNNGMANGSERTLIVATKSGHEIARSAYNTDEREDDTVPNKGIFYRYPADGTIDSVKFSAGVLDATPGTVTETQVPAEKVQLIEDQEKPVIEDKTALKETPSSEPVIIEAKMTDNARVTSAAIFYRTDDIAEFKKIHVEEQEDHHYRLTIFTPELIGKKQLEYYFVASDGTSTVKTEPKQIKIVHDHMLEGLRLNVADGDILSGERLIKATGDHATDNVQLFIDDKELIDKTKALETEAYFAFDIRKTNLYFKNGVTMDDDILHIFDDTVNEFTTLTIPVAPERLNVGENTITIRAGTKVSPFDLESTENRDDFYLKNIRLVLADGTVIRDPNYPDAGKEYGIGDSAGMSSVYDFTFTLDKDQFKANAYLLDTTLLKDGKHELKAVLDEETVSANVLVDNTAPTITPTIKDGETYKGKLTIDAAFTDELSDVTETNAQLNGNYISLPFETSSALLDAGEHEVIFTAMDAAGNKASKTITFVTKEEHPLLPDKSPDEIEATETNLTVKVTDPTGDVMDVSFYEAFQYKATSEEMVISEYASDTEPPQSFAPEGEKRLTDSEREKLMEKDGNTIATESTTQFPYHRFDVAVDEKVKADDIVEIVWNGSSLAGRKVTMYAWNVETSKWEALISTIAGEEDFELIGSVPAGDYMKDGNISVIVQDEIAKAASQETSNSTEDETDDSRDYRDVLNVPVKDGQFSFVWFSDTQYYSESYPHIFEDQVKWIVDANEDLNLKYVFHTGDLVDKHFDRKQWEIADKNMKILDDAHIPYGVLAGNHDVGHKDNDYENYYHYFGEDRYKDRSYFGESYLNNRGHYDLISAEGNDFIMLYMGWGVDEDGIDWMNDVLEKYPNRKAILNFHEYLLASGTRSPIGDKIFEEVVVPNENVYAVLGGHYHNSQKLEDEIDDNGDGNPDRTVYQMLANYQAGPEGGQGFLRIFTFDPETNTMDMTTYSPYLNEKDYYDPELYPGKDSFVVDWDVTPQMKKVETDYVEVNIYTNELIGAVENVPSGETATVVWNDLEPNETYFWYVTAEDKFGGKTTSPIWSFLTKDGEVIEPEEPGDNTGGDDGDESPGPGDDETPKEPGGNDTPGDGEKPGKPGNGKKPGDEEMPGKDKNPKKPSKPGNNNKPGKDGTTNNDGNGPIIEKPKKKDDNSTDNGWLSNNKPNGGNKAGIGLPNTATHMYNYIIAGIALLILGTGTMLLLRRRKTN